MRARPALAAALALVLWAAAAGPAAAATYRVDDAASLPSETTALLRWRSVAPSRARDDLLEGAVAVVVRLNLAPWLGRNARLYIVLPEQGTALTRASWSTQGRLLAGEISPGQRVLVYQGPISNPVLEETLTIQLDADGNRMSGTQRLKFHFEIDTE